MLSYTWGNQEGFSEQQIWDLPLNVFENLSAVRRLKRRIYREAHQLLSALREVLSFLIGG